MAKLTKAEQALLKKMLGNLSEEEKEDLLGEPVKKSTRRKQANFPLGPRPNKFVESSDFGKFKSDSETDKLLWKGKTPEERSKLVKIEATCVNCGTRELVHPIFAYADDKGKRNFTCDKCSK